MKLRIPIDFMQWPELVRLKKVSNRKEEHILSVFFKLYCWLGYMAMVDEIGFIPSGFVPSLWKIIGKDWFRDLCEVKFIVKDESREGKKAGYWCPRFRLDHMHMDLAWSTCNEAKHLSRKHSMRMKNDAKRIDEVAAKLHDTLLGGVKVDHGPRYEDNLRKAIWFICAIDSALGLPPRPLSHYSGGLVNNAHTIVSNTPDPNLQLVVAMLVKYRRNPKIPNVTELVLQNWGDVVNVVLGGSTNVRVQNLRGAEQEAIPEGRAD